MQLPVMGIIGRLVSQQIPLCPGLFEFHKALPLPFPQGKRNRTIWKIPPDRSHNVHDLLIGIPGILSPLEHEGAKTQPVAGLTAGQNLLFRQPIPFQIAIALSLIHIWYLLRHETANDAHYRQLHPANLSLTHRKQCLWQLKELGFQTGAGFMVGSPGQTVDTLIDDLQFLKDLQPEMVGIGPFIPHHDTPFAGEPAGSLEETLYLLSLIRLMRCV